ncbi:MAG: AraC family transcriptional regulator [Bacteroidales bacterium]|nr:AraC family transcriptional regulator [Bacteroidales bacterium]
MKQSKNMMDNIHKKSLVLTLLYGCTLQIEATTANFPLNQIDVTQNSGIFLSDTLASPFLMNLISACFILILSSLLVRLYLIGRKKKKLNDRMIHYIKTVQDFQKALKLIKGSLDEIAWNENLTESQKDKILIAIWSTTNLQGKITNLTGQELDHVPGKKNSLKNAIESNTETSRSLNESSVTPDYDSLPGKETQYDLIFMEKLINILKNNIEDNHFTIDTLSQKIGMSRSSLYHKIKDITGLPPADFIRIYRLEKAKELLKTHLYSISEVAYKTGFSDVKYFRTVFKKVYETTPGHYSKEEE